MDQPERKSFRDLKRKYGLARLAFAMFIVALVVSFFLLLVLAMFSFLIGVVF